MAADASRLAHWQEVIRETPYWESQGVHANLATIRRWVLAGESYCEDEERHILFDRRARFLGYVSTGADRDANQSRINERRKQLADAGKVHAWVAGELGGIGYPFALSCKQPHARLAEALARYIGEDEEARLWGTWDGMRIGTPDAPESLYDAIRQVYEYRLQRGQISLPDHVLGTLAGKVAIESGGIREAHSPMDARGIMQLSPAALRDCGLDRSVHFHRIAQIDCALKLTEQNHRNLEPVFIEHFGHLPEQKAAMLYGMLLLQAYHSGVGRVHALLTDQSLNGAARYFAEHHERFTAGDIALGMIFHNLGRDRLGFASLYYVTDVSIAIREACVRLRDLPGCRGRTEIPKPGPTGAGTTGGTAVTDRNAEAWHHGGARTEIPKPGITGALGNTGHYTLVTPQAGFGIPLVRARMQTRRLAVAHQARLPSRGGESR